MEQPLVAGQAAPAALVLHSIVCVRLFLARLQAALAAGS